MGRKRTADIKPVQKAEAKFETQMKKYEKYQFKNLQDMPKLNLSKYDIDVSKYDLDLSKYGPLDASKYDLDLSKYRQENLLEDMPGMDAYTQAAEFAGEQFQQSQANIMQAYRGAAGASGAAALAQQASGQAAQFARGQQVSLGERAAEARRLAVQEQARIQGQERQLMLQQDIGRRDLMLSEDQKQRELLFAQDTGRRDLQLQQDVTRRDLRLSEDRARRDFGYGKMTTILGVRGEQLGGARQMYASQAQADAQSSAGMWGAVGTIAGAAITASDRRLKKNIRKAGKSPKGLQLYSFEYKDPSDGKGRWQGVIASDLPASVRDKVVHKSADGYDMVNYSKIDVTLKKV